MFPVNIINGLDLWRDTLSFKLTAIFNLLFILMLMIHLPSFHVGFTCCLIHCFSELV